VDIGECRSRNRGEESSGTVLHSDDRGSRTEAKSITYALRSVSKSSAGAYRGDQTWLLVVAGIGDASWEIEGFSAGMYFA
jgi:hypothetical protein